MDPEKKPEEKTGFEALLHQNEIAAAKEKVENPKESLEERIRKTAPPPKNSIVRNIRTLKGDIEENISKGNTTLVSMAAGVGGNGKSGLRVVLGTVTGESSKRLGILLIALLLIIAGGGGIYYVYTLKQVGTVPINDIQSLIFVEKVESVDVTTAKPDEARKDFINKRENINAELGSLIGLRYTKRATSTEGTIETKLITPEELFAKLKLKVPSRLTRSLQNDYLVGIHIFDGNQPFFLFKITSYEAAFAGILDWEKTMADDLGPLLRPGGEFVNEIPSQGIATSTATTTSIIAAPFPFEDFVYKNLDTRVIRNQNGKILLIYAFPTKDTLIITSNTETFSEIFNRLTSRQVVK